MASNFGDRVTLKDGNTGTVLQPAPGHGYPGVMVPRGDQVVSRKVTPVLLDSGEVREYLLPEALADRSGGSDIRRSGSLK